MPLTESQRITRLARRVDELRLWGDRAVATLGGWTFDGRPIAIGDPWPDREGIHLLAHPPVAVPAGWPLEDIRLEIDPGGEGLLHIRYSDGSTEGFGMDPWHRRYPVRGRAFSLEAEVVARRPFGEPSRHAELARAQLVLADVAVERLVRRLALLVDAARVLSQHEVIEPLVSAGEHALTMLCWPSATRAYVSRSLPTRQMQSLWSLPDTVDPQPPGLSAEERDTAVAAAAYLEERLRALEERYPREGAIALTGHAHLDLAWLWPLAETRRKARRTYYTITGLMDRYPELRFNQSSAQLYAFVEEDDPELFARINERVATGQWEPVGGMWVEPDINMPAGESLVRQLLYGQRYFQRTFGSLHTVCWLPDCFGFSPALPQLLRGAGITSFFTIKLTWSQTNVFPYDLFWWEGLDGSRVLAHMFNNPIHEESETSGYNADASPFALTSTWRNFRGKHLSPESLLSIGYGDGGGGVTAGMIEDARELKHFPRLPSLGFTSVREFFVRMHASVEGKRIPVWLGEMYLELHRGTLTSQGRMKYVHRRAERDLVAAEVVSALHRLLGGDQPASLEPLWRVLLRNEFHDILPGSSIREVYQQAESELGAVVQDAGAATSAALEGLAGRVAGGGDRPALFLVNPDLSPRPVRAQVRAPIEGAQAVDGGYAVTAPGDVPGLGARTITAAEPVGRLDVTPECLENDLLRVAVRPDGTLGSLFDKRLNREVLADRGNQLWAYVDKPMSWDAWDVDPGYELDGEEVTDVQSITVAEQGPHRAALRIERAFRAGRIVQDIRLWAHSPRLEFRTTIDWHDRRWLLKARFRLAVRSQRATFETAFGVVERPTHRNTTWEAARFEVAGHRFVDLSEPGYGVALLNDGKYGHHALENELGLSLLRSPIHPDPLADEGTQTFTYALLPHAGDWLEGGVLAEAEDLNRPLLAQPVRARESGVWQAIRLDGLPLGLGTLKAAEDGDGLILRAYEPRGARGPVALSLPPGWEAAEEVDLLERSVGAPQMHFGPFQVRSWLLRRR